MTWGEAVTFLAGLVLGVVVGLELWVREAGE